MKKTIHFKKLSELIIGDPLYYIVESDLMITRLVLLEQEGNITRIVLNDLRESDYPEKLSMSSTSFEFYLDGENSITIYTTLDELELEVKDKQKEVNSLKKQIKELRKKK